MASSWPPTLKRFYKIIVDDRAPIIYIPSDLDAEFRGLLRRNCTLRTPIGQAWTVYLDSRDGRVCFTNGWHEFFNQNNIQFGFLVFFTPVAGYSFDVLIFNRLAAETKDYGTNPLHALCGTSFRVTMTRCLVERPRFVIPINFWKTFIKKSVNSTILINGDKQWAIEISNDNTKHTMEGGCRKFIVECAIRPDAVVEFRILKRHPLTLEVFVLN